VKKNWAETNGVKGNDTGWGALPAEKVGEPGGETTARAGELSPIMLQGQKVGWRVVKANSAPL